MQKTVIRVSKPTMIVRAYQPAPNGTSEAHYQRILVPLDGSQRAECVLPLVSSLADFHDAKLILAHVVRKPELPRRAPPSQEERDLAEELVERNQREVAGYLNQIRDRLPANVETLISVGEDVSDNLHNLVDELNPDLVVISAHGYSGSAHRPYGSLALNFIAYGTSPLLIVQDIPKNYAFLPTAAELASREQPGH